MIPSPAEIALQRARETVAARYPESMGTIAGTTEPLPCIPRKANLSGAWDNGSLVREALAKEAER